MSGQVWVGSCRDMCGCVAAKVHNITGNFTRGECHDQSAEKIQRVKCFMFEVRNLLRASNFGTPARPAGFENFRLWSIGGSGGFILHNPITPPKKHQTGRSACAPASPPRPPPY